jgi:hypothetical protein
MGERPEWFDSVSHVPYGWWVGPLVELPFYLKRITQRLTKRYL